MRTYLTIGIGVAVTLAIILLLVRASRNATTAFESYLTERGFTTTTCPRVAIDDAPDLLTCYRGIVAAHDVVLFFGYRKTPSTQGVRSRRIGMIVARSTRLDESWLATWRTRHDDLAPTTGQLDKDGNAVLVWSMMLDTPANAGRVLDALAKSFASASPHIP